MSWDNPKKRAVFLSQLNSEADAEENEEEKEGRIEMEGDYCSRGITGSRVGIWIGMDPCALLGDG